jgi:hypothetical protein
MAQLKDFQTGAVGDSFNGPIGTSTAAAGAFTTLAASGSVTLSGGTANGVTYLNGSKVLTSGSNFTYSNGLTVNGITQAYNTTLYTVDGTLSNYSSTNGVYLAGNAAGWLNLAGDGTNATFVRIYGASYATPNIIQFNTASSERMRLDASGNLGIGISSPTQKLDVYGNGMKVNNASYVGYLGAGNTFNVSGAASDFCVRSDNVLSFAAGGPYERARITSGGYFKASSNGGYLDSAGSYHEIRQTNASNQGLVLSCTDGSYTSQVIQIRASRNTTNDTFYVMRYFNDGAGAYKFNIADSGNVTNTNGSYGTISDVKMKTDIVDAGSQWADIKAIRFRKYKMKDDPSGLFQLGVVAQELEQTSAGLISEHKDVDGEGVDLGTTTKSVKTSILFMKAAKALQEAMIRIEQLEARLDAANL